VFADMHDGDKKEVTISGSALTIKPSGNNQTWKVTATLDTDTCDALVDFDVPGKPNPPPVKLLMRFWSGIGDVEMSGREKATFEFTDPSGKLASPATPLNSWLAVDSLGRVAGEACPETLRAIYADMHDGDRKAVKIEGGKITITPSGNNQTWVVEASLDSRCSAMINFRVPGKPSPPPVDLRMALWHLRSGSAKKLSWEFTDPSGTLAQSGFPLNAWLQLPLGALFF